MFYFEQLICEQVQPPMRQQVPPPPPPPQQVQKQPVQNVPSEQDDEQFDFSEEELEASEGDATSQDVDSSLIPIKRYFLIQKLFALNEKLSQLRIRNDILSLVITFIDSFSYESLLQISDKIAEEVAIQVNMPIENTEEDKN